MSIAMKNCIRPKWVVALGFVLATLFIPNVTFARMGGIDYLPDYLSVSDFSVNGTGGFQAGSGGAGAPGPVIPETWYPGFDGPRDMDG
jgi:hypothetical protein